MTISRRRFLGTAAAISAGFVGLRCADPTPRNRGVFGPLGADPRGLLGLPEGFRYTVFSIRGETMDDGFLVPGLHDGMATFPGPREGLSVLVRNHEVSDGDDPALGAFGSDLSLLDRLDSSLLYDAGTGEGPALGGTTTLVFDTREQRLLSHRLSLGGTLRNCAGGPTPWGSWITCEETLDRAGGRLARDHGWCFEVDASPEGPVTRAEPLTAMGRFNHEAVAVDPASGVVYLTEDHGAGLLYRYIPDVPGALARGGRLQALAVLDLPAMDTRNWAGRAVEPGTPLGVHWIDLDDIDSPDGDLHERGHAAGAARFARGEGIWYGNGEVYFACTNGGEARKGQIWRYRPSPSEGTADEAEARASLELFVEPNDGTLVENADNLCVAPWGDLIVCEDGTGDDYLVGVTPEGLVYPFARNLNGDGEFAGACFSADGSTLFVNMQSEGVSVAITGPWESARP